MRGHVLFYPLKPCTQLQQYKLLLQKYFSIDFYVQHSLHDTQFRHSNHFENKFNNRTQHGSLSLVLYVFLALIAPNEHFAVDLSLNAQIHELLQK